MPKPNTGISWLSGKGQKLIKNYRKAVEGNAYAGSYPKAEAKELGDNLADASIELCHYIARLEREVDNANNALEL